MPNERDQTVTFRPDSRNGYKDYQIDMKTAKELMQNGKICGDATNGGYMPIPNSPFDFHTFKATYEVKPEPKFKRKKR